MIGFDILLNAFLNSSKKIYNIWKHILPPWNHFLLCWCLIMVVQLIFVCHFRLSYIVLWQNVHWREHPWVHLQSNPDKIIVNRSIQKNNYKCFVSKGQLQKSLACCARKSSCLFTVSVLYCELKSLVYVTSTISKSMMSFGPIPPLSAILKKHGQGIP